MPDLNFGNAASSVTTGLDLLEDEIARLRAENGRLTKALQEVKAAAGAVCPDFELCHHEACASSYAAYAIADAALRE